MYYVYFILMLFYFTDIVLLIQLGKTFNFLQNLLGFILRLTLKIQ